MTRYQCPACGNAGTVGPRCPVCGVNQGIAVESADVAFVERAVSQRRTSAFNPHDAIGPIAVFVVAGVWFAECQVRHWPNALFFAPLAALFPAVFLVFAWRWSGRVAGRVWQRIRFGLATRSPVPIANASRGRATIRGRVRVVQSVTSTQREVCAAYVSRVPVFMDFSLLSNPGSKIRRRHYERVQGPHPNRYDERSASGIFDVVDDSGVAARVDVADVRLYAPIAGSDGEVRIVDGDEVVVRGEGVWIDDEAASSSGTSRRMFLIAGDRPVFIAPAGFRWQSPQQVGSVRANALVKGEGRLIVLSVLLLLIALLVPRVHA